MPADPPLTLGTLAQTSFARRFHFRPKIPPRAGSTLKFSPTAKGSTKGVVGCGLSQVLSEDDQCLAALLRSLSPLSPTPPPLYPVRFQIRQHIQVRVFVQRQKAKRNGRRALFATAGADDSTTMLSSFPRVPLTFMLTVMA